MPELPSNPVPFEVLTDSEVPPRTGIEIVAYSYSDPFAPLDVIPRRTDPKFLDEVGGPGGGSFRMPRDDDKLTETPTLLDYRNIFKCVLDNKVVGAFIATQKTSDYINQQERAGEYWELSGEGLRGWLHDAVVEPYGGVRTDSQEQRVFSFASEQGSWYKPADWLAPVSVQQYNMDPNPGPFGTAPAEWPDAPGAHWIWGVPNNGTTTPAPEGINYFRYEFDITGLVGSASYAMFASGKGDFDVFLDGQSIIEVREDDAYAKTFRADFELTNGHHILAARVLSKGTGAAGFIGAFFKSGDATAGTSATLINVTDTATWKVNAYPDPAPGWTPGEIMLTLLEEAEARGVRFPTYLTPTFTAELDSDGVAWTRALDWAFDIGSEYADVVEKLEELVCDLWIDPSNYELHLYAERGTHRDVQSEVVQPVKFEVARNVMRATSEGTSEIKNALVIQTADGWQKISDSLSSSIATYGRIEGYVSTGASASVSSDVAQRVFASKAKPKLSATYDIVDVDDARPFVDFFPGDWVLAPSEESDGVLTTRRVMSISVAENAETGETDFALEFDTIAEDLARRFDRWLKTTSDGTLGGTLANVSGGGGGGGGTPNGQPTSGPQGQSGPRGLPGFYYRGIWSDSETYEISDVVAWEGQYWVAHTETTGTPGISSDWDPLEVAPSTTPAIGITLSLASVYPAPSAATPIPWTSESYKSNVTHDLDSANIVIQESGPYLISGKFAITSINQLRDYALQVNGVTVASCSTDTVQASSSRAVADLPARLVDLAAGDVVRILSNGGATHSLLNSSDTWISITKVTGAEGPAGPEGPQGPAGATGPAGPGLIILATLANTGELPPSGSPGDAYLINGDLWIWDTISSSWENGGGISGSRQTVTYTTASLASGAQESGTVALAQGYDVLKVQLSGPARVRLYDTAAHRDADASRPAGTDPSFSAGVMLDFSSNIGAGTWGLSPVPKGVNFDPGSAVAIIVDNLSGGSATVSVTFTYRRTE